MQQDTSKDLEVVGSILHELTGVKLSSFLFFQFRILRQQEHTREEKMQCYDLLLKFIMN